MTYTKEQQLRKRLERTEKKLAKAKATPLKLLHKELKRITHKIVRLKADRCYCCNKPLPEFKDRCAGHFWSDGGHSNTRYDFRNLRVCCVGCNSFKSGNLAEYGYRLKNELGADEFDRLYTDAHTLKRWGREELESMIAERKNILNNLK